MSNWSEDDVRRRNEAVFGSLERADWKGTIDLSGRRAEARTEAGSNPVNFNDASGATTRPGQIDEPEALIQEECTKILEADGWRSLRTDPVSDRGRGKGFGEIGMADMLYIRYDGFKNILDISTPTKACTEICIDALTQIMWIEFKRSKSAVVSKAQRAWHTIERARGALTLIAGEEFVASIAGFRNWYAASGLQRRVDL